MPETISAAAAEVFSARVQPGYSESDLQAALAEVLELDSTDGGEQ